MNETTAAKRGKLVPIPRVPNIEVHRRQSLDEWVENVMMHRGAKSVGLMCWTRPNGRLDGGTGTLLQHGGEWLVLTCAHVARGFLASKEAGINFSQGTYLPRDQVTAHRHDTRDDVALLRVVGRALRNTHLEPMTLAGLRHESDYRRASNTPGFALLGFPTGLVEHREKAMQCRSLTYMTVPHEQKPSTTTSLILEYPHGVDPLLPEPDGLSGSLIFEVTKPEKEKMLLPPQAIAIQSSAQIVGRRKWIRGRSLRRVFQWLR